ncbi:aryl-sulfate sulfotransferase [Halopelagius longus]|uniref:Arylsulfotransferase (ASST) n=1 Tax=Halopelagius longus TaxID=1236180 RepID=A0A1H1C0W0_9EURY|nr:aryl-sulfate sulfotransferase [Halopelagius longus]RDI71015.1 hypothetical protein DWB78_04325 [Halopelagius longus]SDQ57852.1 Arylsulfotransferase (ASST) [Halopelagius longus]
MSRISQKRVGQALFVTSVVAVALFFAVTALTTPSVSTETDSEFRTIVGVQGSPDGRVAVIDSSGDVLWEDRNATNYHDVTVLDNGNILTAFLVKEETECGRFESPCPRTGVRIIDPDTREVTWNYTFPVRSHLNSEVHDAEVLPSNEVVVADMEYERVFTVDRNGTITWQWNASSYYEAPADPTETDWLHINDVDHLGDGRFLVSVRNAHQLLIIERGEGVVDVINEDRDPSMLYYQHNPQWLGDGAVLVADSENDRIVELHENQSTGEWEAAWSVSSAGGVAFDWPRDADRLPNGNTLVTDSRNNRVVEVNESGGVVWSQRVAGMPYEADRLPVGEQVGAQRYGDNGAVSASTATPAAETSEPSNASIPMFSRAYAALTHVYVTPYWVTPWHLVVATVGLVGALVGAVLWWRG